MTDSNSREPAGERRAPEPLRRSHLAASRLDAGWRAHQAGRLQEAEGRYQQVLAENDSDPDALHLLGLLSHHLGRSQAGVELVRLAIRNNPNDAHYHSNLAVILDALGRHQEAAIANQRALAINPTAFGACFGLANEQRMLGQVEASIATYRRALTINPRHAGALSNLGSALEALGHHDEAIECFTRASEIAPGQASIFSNLGNALQSVGRREDAIRAFRQAIRLEPDFADAHSNLGVALLQNRNVTAALSAFDACLHVDPAHRSALAFKSIALHESGQHNKAAQICDLSLYIAEKKFAAVTGYADIAAFNRELEKHVLSHGSLEYEPISKSTKRGQQSGNLLVGEMGPIARLEEMIRREVSAYLQHPPFGADHPYYGKAPAKWSLNVWATILDSQGHQAPHMHPGGWLSGVYYVTLPDCIGEHGTEGWIEFGATPDELRCKGEHPTRLICPAEGKMLVFPSFFFHHTIPFESEKRRISIAFDVIPEL